MSEILFGWGTQRAAPQADPHEGRPVLILRAREEGKTTAIEINRDAKTLLGVDGELNTCLAFGRDLSNPGKVYVKAASISLPAAVPLKNMKKLYSKVSHKGYYDMLHSELSSIRAGDHSASDVVYDIQPVEGQDSVFVLSPRLDEEPDPGETTTTPDQPASMQARGNPFART